MLICIDSLVSRKQIQYYQLFIQEENFVTFKYNLYKRETAFFLSVVAVRIDFPSKSCYLLPAPLKKKAWPQVCQPFRRL